MSELNTKRLLNQLIAGRDLAGSEMQAFVGAVMDGEVDPAVVAGVLVALRIKGETGAEVAAAARAMRERALTVPVTAPDLAVDTCGTGGDGADTVNISTAAAAIAAAAGVKVAKHGNRSVSSKCGSADVLEAAGVRLDLGPDDLGALHDELGIAFLFAPRLHPAMGAVMPVRRAMGVRTIFNMLGPLTNPAGVSRQVVGVWGPEIQDLVAAALADLGATHAMVAHSEDGLDELSVCAPTRVLEVRDGELVGEHRVDPADFGFAPGNRSELAGGDVAFNTDRLKSVLCGEERSSAVDAAVLNAAAAIVVAGEAEDLAAGVARAADSVRAGKPLELLQTLATRSQELADHG